MYIPLNQAVGGVAGQPISLVVVPQVGESAGRPVRRRKRSRMAIEAADEPILRFHGRKR